MPQPPDLAAILSAINENPDDGDRWLKLASWLCDNSRDDEAAAVEVFWPTLRDNVMVSSMSLRATLRDMPGFGLLIGGQVHDKTPRRFSRCQFKPPPE